MIPRTRYPSWCAALLGLSIALVPAMAAAGEDRYLHTQHPLQLQIVKSPPSLHSTMLVFAQQTGRVRGLMKHSEELGRPKKLIKSTEKALARLLRAATQTTQHYGQSDVNLLARLWGEVLVGNTPKSLYDLASIAEDGRHGDRDHSRRVLELTKAHYEGLYSVPGGVDDQGNWDAKAIGVLRAKEVSIPEPLEY